MYQIKCDDYILYDQRDDALVVLNPKCKLEVNTVCGASFGILKTHPYFTHLQRLKSIFEIKQDNQVIFRGRMTNDSRDFHNQIAVDLEGVLAYTNDSIIPPFSFPDDVPNATESENIVECFLAWILQQHNEQVEDWKQLKVGKVTVTDPNNYITKSSDAYSRTWDVLKSKLFDSTLGGYLFVRYEDDGNYVDYVTDFSYTNTQQITLEKNLLDIKKESDASETYSAILPLGAEIENEDGSKKTVSLVDLPDGDLTDDLVKKGRFIYSKSAREKYGWICVPPDDAKWTDVTSANNLQTKAMEYLSGTATSISGTITIKAVDLSFTDEEIQTFRICRNVLVNSPAHDVSKVSYPLTKLDIDILNPQNTTITVGDTARTLADVNDTKLENVTAKIEGVKNELTNSVNSMHRTMLKQQTAILTDCENIIMSALESYVETGEYSEFKKTIETQFSIMSDSITMSFSRTEENINNVAGDLQAEIIERKKNIAFSENGITLKAGENAMTLELDNDMIKFKKNGVQFGWWDGVDFHTGNIVVDVNERAQFGNFAFVPRSDGSLMFLKVGE